MKLYTKITIGLVAGVIVGWALNSWYDAQPFENADQDKNGFVSVPELLSSDGLERYKVSGEVAKADKNRDNILEWSEVHSFLYAEQMDYITYGFESADLDQNGQLSRYEAIAKEGRFAPYGKPATFAKADTNGDEQLSLAEIKQAEFQESPVQKMRRFNEADKDRDGFLTRAELVSAGAGFSALLDRTTWKSADWNKDSLLSLNEVGWFGLETTRFIDQAAFAKADGNGDGVLSRTEERRVSGAQRFTIWTDPVGKIFINLVKMVVVPLILASLILGAANLGDIRKLGSIGLKAFGFFMLTTAVAVAIGVGSANLFRPGDGLPDDKKQELLSQYQKEADAKVDAATSGPKQSEAEKILDLFVRMVPTNPIQAMATNDMLAIIFFALFIGLCLTMIPPEKASTFIAFVDGLNEVILKMVILAMETAPYGVFALIVGVVADMGIDILLPLLKYGGVVVGALLLHVCITHFSFIAFYLKKNPLQFMAAIKEALLLGFSTSSSSATLPISMNVTQMNLGVSKEVTSFVLPLGATVNMDGTALYQGVAAIFIAQVYGLELSFTSQIIMVLTATLASVGAAGVPGAGMITLAVVLSTADIPVEGVALIFGLDRLLDMFRTTINITGDITCAAVMAKSEGENIEIHKDRDIIPG